MKLGGRSVRDLMTMVTGKLIH